jgi:hypothetical protein
MLAVLAAAVALGVAIGIMRCLRTSGVAAP